MIFQQTAQGRFVPVATSMAADIDTLDSSTKLTCSSLNTVTMCSGINSY